jgi:glucokinase
LGIDVGGTKIAGAVVNLASGALLARRQVPTNPERGGEAVLEDVLGMASSLRDAARATGLEPLGLGLGVAELVDPGGRVFSGYRIAWNGLPVRERLTALLPAQVEADVRAAALAEARLGAGRGIDHFLYVTIGTGVSAVSVQHGRPYAGSRGAALVIANGRMRHRCPHCHRDFSLVLEDLAGGAGLAQAMHLDRAEQVLAAADAGDEAASALIDHATRELGQTLALLVGTLDPVAIVVGGGLGSAPGRYFESLRRAVTEGLWDGDSRVLTIRQAEMGADAGIIGAALSAPVQAEPGDGVKGNT